MIKKDNLLKQLNALIGLEKDLIPLLNKHVSSSLFFSELEKSAREKILQRFKNISVSQTKHVEILDSIKKEASECKSDVY